MLLMSVVRYPGACAHESGDLRLSPTIGARANALTPKELEHELPTLKECLHEREFEMLRRCVELIPALDEDAANGVRSHLVESARSLPLLASAIRSTPTAGSPSVFGGRQRDATTLIESLCSVGDAVFDFRIPTKAVLGRAFVQTKINFFRALRHLLDYLPGDQRETREGVDGLIGDAVYVKLSDEILSSVLTNESSDVPIRKLAAEKLILTWNQSVELSVESFPSVLLSAWRARGKVRTIFGSMMGVTEVFSLIAAECESRFVNYFSRDDVPSDEHQAFQEFLFALSFEELNQVKQYMMDHDLVVVTPDEVNSILAMSRRPAIDGYPTAEQMYSSYCRRKTRAAYREEANCEGPRRTAEGYIMESVLRSELGGPDPLRPDSSAT